MTGAWNHASGRATVLVERLARARYERLDLASTLLDASRLQEAEEAALTSMIWGDPDLKNDGQRKAVLKEQAGLGAAGTARDEEDSARDALARCDAEIAADHDRLMLVRAELAWLTATAGQQREEGMGPILAIATEVGADLRDIANAIGLMADRQS